MRLRFLGQSGFQLRDDGHEVVVDPFLSGNDATPVEPGELNPGHIVLSHAHGDHFGDTLDIAKRSGAKVVGSFEIGNYVSARGVEGVGMNVGGGADFPFGHLKFTPAWHSNSFPDGSYAGMPAGIVLEMGGKRIYHSGDTALFGDMRLIGRLGLDVALLPIGDFFTMGPDDALEAVKLLSPRMVIPMHFDTFDVIRQDAGAFKRRVESETDARCAVLRPGEALEL